MCGFVGFTDHRPAEEKEKLLKPMMDRILHRGPSMAGHFVDGRPATVGVIATVTRNFCAACDRTRLTAEGRVRTCLFSREETDLRTALRSGAEDEEIATIWRAAQWGKKAGHGMDREDFVQPERPMSAIGG